MTAGLMQFLRSASAKPVAIAGAVAAFTFLPAGCGSVAASGPGTAGSGSVTASSSTATSIGSPRPASGGAATAASGTPAHASHSSSTGVIFVRDNANGTTVSIRAGDTLELILSSTYWKVAGSSAPNVLQQEGATVLMPRPSTCPSVPGLGCTPQRTNFKALSSGEAVITASRLTCGEALACQSRARLFRLTVVVSA